jgi:hypothetical protein
MVLMLMLLLRPLGLVAEANKSWKLVPLAVAVVGALLAADSKHVHGPSGLTSYTRLVRSHDDIKELPSNLDGALVLLDMEVLSRLVRMGNIIPEVPRVDSIDHL